MLSDICNKLIMLLPPQLDWMQVDVSSHGAGGGRLSIKQAVTGEWERRHMPLELFKQVAPYLHRVRMLHLQGWGEPLANPDFFRIAALGRKANCRLTTSVFDGAFLRESTLEKLLELGFASLTVNVSSLDERLHEQRRGTDLELVRKGLERLMRLRQDFDDGRLRVMALYTLFRSSMDELERLPEYFAPLGVRTILVNPLVAVPDAGEQQETVVPESQEAFDALQARLEAVAAEAARRGLGFHYFLLHGGGRKVRCIENVQRALYLSATGEVAPCVFAQVPAEEAQLIFQGMRVPLRRQSFGNVRRELLRHIWNSPAYRAFRGSVSRGVLPQSCALCWRPHIVAC